MKGLEAFLELTKLDLGKPLQNAGNEEIYKKMSLVKKELKAFDIIKEKGIDVGFLKTCKDVKEYNYYCFDEETDKTLTTEEFNLLKEILKCI
jgi:mannose/fructose/N-acetylgalactosamine-specific phosphotransferase system component IIB